MPLCDILFWYLYVWTFFGTMRWKNTQIPMKSTNKEMSKNKPDKAAIRPRLTTFCLLLELFLFFGSISHFFCSNGILVINTRYINMWRVCLRKLKRSPTLINNGRYFIGSITNSPIKPPRRTRVESSCHFWGCWNLRMFELFGERKTSGSYQRSVK